jgi:hypothetical protein
MVPQPSLGVCLTRELRLLAGTATSSAPGGDRVRLAAELIEADQRFGSVIWRDGYRPLDQHVELALRVRLVASGGRLVWGPTVYRVVRRVPASSAASAAAGLATAQEGLRWSCQAVARQVIDDIRLFLSFSRASVTGR